MPWTSGDVRSWGVNPRSGSVSAQESSGSDRGDIVREIFKIVMEEARGLAPGGQDPFEDELPGG